TITCSKLRRNPVLKNPRVSVSGSRRVKPVASDTPPERRAHPLHVCHFLHPASVTIAVSTSTAVEPFFGFAVIQACPVTSSSRPKLGITRQPNAMRGAKKGSGATFKNAPTPAPAKKRVGFGAGLPFVDGHRFGGPHTGQGFCSGAGS